MKSRHLSVFTVIAALLVITQSASAMYHPGLGRFMQRDSIEYQAGSMSLYQYVDSRPTYYVDPTGNTPWIGIAGRAINESEDKCAIVWSDYPGDWEGYKPFRPGDDTGGWGKDQNDYIYLDGHWYKNRSRKVYIDQEYSSPYYWEPVVDEGDRDLNGWSKKPLKPIKPDDDTKSPGKGNWPAPPEDVCRQYCECNSKRDPRPWDCKDVEDCVKKCRDPFGGG